MDELKQEEITKAMTEQAELNAEKDTIQFASQMYQQNLMPFKHMCSKLSSRAKTRVLQALVEYPFNMREYKHSTEQEKSAMNYGLKALECKFILEMAGYTQAWGNILTNDSSDAKVEKDMEEKNG